MIKRFKTFVNKRQIERFCEKQRIVRYEITNDFMIDVDGDVDLSDSLETDEIPYKFGIVTGYFNCSRNGLTSLKNCPDEVGGDFDFSENRVTNFEFAPKKVGESMDGTQNLLSSFNNIPEVEHNTQLAYNKFKSVGDLNLSLYDRYGGKYLSLHKNPITYLTVDEYLALDTDDIGGLDEFPITTFLSFLFQIFNDINRVLQEEDVKFNFPQILERIIEFEVIKDIDKIDILSMESMFEFFDIDIKFSMDVFYKVYYDSPMANAYKLINER